MCACVRACRGDKRGNRLEPTTSTHHRLSHTQTSRYLNLRLSLCTPDTCPPLQQPPLTHTTCCLLTQAHWCIKTGTHACARAACLYEDRCFLFVENCRFSVCYYHSQLHSIMWHPETQVVIQRQPFQNCIQSNILENTQHFHIKPIKCLSIGVKMCLCNCKLLPENGRIMFFWDTETILMWKHLARKCWNQWKKW